MVKQGCSTKWPWEHRGDHFNRIRNFQSRQRIGEAVEDAHFRRSFSQMKSQVWPWHPFGMEVSDQKIDRARARLGKFERLDGVCRGQDEKIGFFQNLLNGVPQRFQVLHEKDDRMHGRVSWHCMRPSLNIPGCLPERLSLAIINNHKVNSQ